MNMRDSLGREPTDWPPHEEMGMPPGHPGAEMTPFPSEAWVFTPASDIKAKDIAEIMALFQMGLPQEFFDKVPPHLKKHFKWKALEV